MGPTVYMLGLGTESLGVFLWAVRFAWAPMATLVLGMISRCYTVREFIQVNLVFPALFAIVWMTTFGELAIYEQVVVDADPCTVLTEDGIKVLLYTLFRNPPLAAIIRTVSWVMVSVVGIDGVRLLSSLGGLTSMVIVLPATSALWIWTRRPELLIVEPDEPLLPSETEPEEPAGLRG